MEAILLVGGRGTRLQPLTDTRPKPMLPIAGAPFLAHQLAWLRSHGITRVTFACGFLPQAIVAAFGDGAALDMQLSYVVEPQPLGTGGAIGFAARSLERGPVVVCNGDVLTGLDLTALVSFHREKNAIATIALTPVDDPSRYGLVRRSAEGAVEAFLEKPRPEEIDTNLINAGTYVLEPAAIDRIPEGAACSVERDIFPQLVGSGLYCLADDSYWNDIGTPESYLRANIDVLTRRFDSAASRARGRSTAIDPSATVSADAVLHAPIIIGPEAVVRAGATIGPEAVVGAGCMVEEGSRVARSVLLEGVTLEGDSQVVDSIVGEHATVSEHCSVSDGAVVGPTITVVRPIVRGAAS